MNLAQENSLHHARIGVFVNKKLPERDYRIRSARQLSDRYQFTFFWPGEALPFPELKYGTINVGEGLSWIDDIKGFIRVFLSLNFGGYDICHFFSSKLYLLGPLLRIPGGPKCIITVTGLGRLFVPPFSFRKRIGQRLFRLFFRVSSHRAHSVLFQNRSDMLLFAGIVPQSKSQLFHSAVEEYSCENTPRPKSKQKQIVMVSRLHPSKGIYDAIAVAENLRRGNIEATIVLVGEKSSKQNDCYEWVCQKSREGIVDYRGPVSNVYSILHESDIFLFLSHREGLPRAILEAGVCKLPVVCYDVPGCTELVEDRVTGLVCPFGDIQSVVDRIQFLLDNPTERTRLGENLNRKIQTEYSEQRYTADLDQLYSILLADSNQSQKQHSMKT